MKKHASHLSLSLYVCFTAVLTIAVGQDIVCYKYIDLGLLLAGWRVNISCDAGKIIIVNSAVIGANDNSPLGLLHQCSIKNICLNEITLVAELCTGRNSCDIDPNFIVDASQTLCLQTRNPIFNAIKINYTCIVAVLANYGDICHFDGGLNSGDAVYISSYPNFPDFMGPAFDYQCSCLLTSKNSSSANVTIRDLLVKLTGVFTTCSERLSIIDSKGSNILEICSPCTSTNNVTTISLSSSTVISFRRDSTVSPYNGKFILEIAVSSGSSGGSSVGSMKCGFNSSSISTTTTGAIVSQPNRVSSTNVQNTSFGATLGSSIIATNAEQSTLSSSKSAAETRSSSIPTGDGERTIASRSASEKNSLSIGGIIGIVLGSVGLIVIVIIVLLCLLRKRKQYRDLRKENTNFYVQPSDTVMQNMRMTNSIDSHDANSSELYSFQSAAHFSNDPQTRGNESKSQTEDNSMSNYEEGAPVSVATYGPGMIQVVEHRRLRHEIANDLTTETQSMNSGDGDITLVENQLYVESAKPVTDAVVSDDYDVARPVVQDVGKEKSAEVNGVYAVVQPMTNSVDHSYYNVPVRTGNGTDYSPVEVSAEAGASSASDERAASNPMYKADSDVVLIDNTLYGSMLAF